MTDAGLDPPTDVAHEGEGGEGDTLEQLEQLAIIQQELDKINDEASDKVLQIEQEYNRIRRPVYERRLAIINKLPGFWRAVLLNHPVASGYINETDEDILEHLVQMDVQDYADVKSGFSITFTFDAAQNPYFTNEVLVKHFKYSDDGLTTTGDVPKWKDGMEPFRPEEEEPPVVGDKRPAPGLDIRFFSWFVEEEVHELGNHDELAEVIKEEIWPNPYKYFVSAESELFGDAEDDDEEGLEFDAETAALENGSTPSEGASDDDEDDGGVQDGQDD